MFLVSKSQPYGFQCEKTNKKNTTFPAYFSASIFSSWSSKHFFFAWPKRKKGFIGSGGYNFFQGMIFFNLSKQCLHRTVRIIRSLFSKVILVFKIHHYGLMWIICLHNISRTTSWNIFLHCGCFFESFLGLNYIYRWSSQFSKLTTWGQCELFVCTISQEPLDEIFSY